MSGFGRIDLPLISILITAFSVLAAGMDLLWGRIFNWLTVTMFVSGLVFAFVRGSWPALGDSLLGAAAGLILYGWMFALKAMGGGDVKFLMALGAWGGLAYTIEVAILGILLGGAMAFVILVFKGRIVSFALRMRQFLMSVFVKELHLEAPKIDHSLTMPFGLPIAIAAIWCAYAHPLREFLAGWGLHS